MPSKEEVKSVRGDLFNQIEKFDVDSKQFRIEFKRNTDIIARYDEIICQKASNQRVHQQKRDIE